LVKLWASVPAAVVSGIVAFQVINGFVIVFEHHRVQVNVVVTRQAAPTLSCQPFAFSRLFLSGGSGNILAIHLILQHLDRLIALYHLHLLHNAVRMVVVAILYLSSNRLSPLIYRLEIRLLL